MKRRIFLYTLAGLVAALALSATLLVAVVYGWQRDWLRREFETRLTTALQTPVSIGSIEGPLHRDVTVRALYIGEPSDLLLEWSALRVRLGALRLTETPTLVIAQAELSRPQLRLRRGADGRWPWETSDTEGTEPTAGLPFGVIIDDLRLDGGVVEATDGANVLARFELDGTLEDARAGATLSFGKLQLAFAARGSTASMDNAIRGSLETSYTDGRWSSVVLRAEGLGVELEARGSGNPGSIESAAVSARIASLDVLDEQLLGNALGLSGLLSISADLSGPLHWPMGRLTVEAADIRSADLEFGGLRLEAISEREGRLRIDALRFEGGPLELAAEPGVEVIADATETSIHGLEFRGKDGTSLLRIDLETSPIPFTGLDALLDDVATRALIEAEAWPLGTLEPLWRAAGIEVDGLLDANLALTGADGSPQLRGTARLRSAAIRISDAAAVGLQADVEVDGALLAPRAMVRASAESISWEDRPLGAVRIAFEMRDGRVAEIGEFALSGGPLSLRVARGARLRAERDGLALENFDISLEGQQLAVSGWIAPRGAEELRLEFPALDARRLVEIASALGASVVAVETAGKIGGQLVWDGPIEDPTLTGELIWSNARLGELAFERVEAGVETEQGMVALKSHWVHDARAALDVEALLPANRILSDSAASLDDPRASLRLRADQFELAALSAFLPAEISSLTGLLSADLRAKGGAQPPALTGRLAIDQGSTVFRALGGKKRWPFSLHAKLNGEWIDVETLQIGEEMAGIRGAGTLQLASGRPSALDLQLGFESFDIDLPGLVKGMLDGPVAVTGTLDAPELRGKLELAEFRVQIPEPDAPEFKEIRILAADGSDAGAELSEDARSTPLFDRLRLDLAVAVRRNSWARGRGANVELEGNLEAKKDPGQPLSLSGLFETVRGTYEIYGRRFRIDRGEATLDGAAEVDPLLDVRAEHKVRDVKIIALLDGRLSEPRLRFESDPELSETDIASYLFLGRPATDAGGERQGALDAAAARIATGVALSELERIFGGALPVDLLDVKMEGSGEESEVRAGVGKYVGERLFLHYEHGFADEGEDELTAEYELTPNWSVESNASSNEELGADLVFEVEN